MVVGLGLDEGREDVVVVDGKVGEISVGNGRKGHGVVVPSRPEAVWGCKCEMEVWRGLKG